MLMVDFKELCDIVSLAFILQKLVQPLSQLDCLFLIIIIKQVT